MSACEWWILYVWNWDVWRRKSSRRSYTEWFAATIVKIHIERYANCSSLCVCVLIMVTILPLVWIASSNMTRFHLKSEVQLLTLACSKTVTWTHWACFMAFTFQLINTHTILMVVVFGAHYVHDGVAIIISNLPERKMKNKCGYGNAVTLHK